MFLRYLLLCFIFDIFVISGYELVGTIIVFRHGARTPRLFHPKDPYRNMSFWPVPLGELTEEGQNQAYELGKWVRENYKNWLPERYSSEDFFIYSSGIDRTLMSASLFAAGLYSQKPFGHLPYQAIPVHSKPPHLDNTILSDEPCPKRDFLVQKTLNEPFFKKINKENEEVYTYLSENMGMPVTDFKGLHSYYDTFFIEERNNLTLPEWTKKVYPEKLLELAVDNLIARTYYLESIRFRAGSLCSEILAYLTSFSGGIQEFVSDFGMGGRGRKMLAVSGHDISVSDLLSILKYPIDFWPSYSSSVIFELRRKNGSEFFVSVSFRNVTGMHEVEVKGCGNECKLNEFVEYMRPYVMNPNEWKNQCVLGENFDSTFEDYWQQQS